MPKPKKTKRTQQNSFFSGDSILRVIGFTADMIAIVTVLLAIKIESVPNALPRILSPWILFPIWILAAYTYLCWLHSNWRKTMQEQNWSKRFRVFVVGDLLVRFRSPYLLIPVLLLVITFILIAKSAEILGVILTAFAIISLVTGLFILIEGYWNEVKDSFVNVFVLPQDEEEDNKKRQERIDIVNSRWEELATIIEKKFEGRTVLNCDDFTELFYAWELNAESILYAFAKYAAEHPGKIYFGSFYGTLWQKEL